MKHAFRSWEVLCVEDFGDFLKAFLRCSCCSYQQDDKDDEEKQDEGGQHQQSDAPPRDPVQPVGYGWKRSGSGACTVKCFLIDGSRPWFAGS